MSWLFVVSVPGLLMLVTFGLDRLESRLNRGAVRADDVAEFLAQAQPGDVDTLARDGMPEALDCFHRRRMMRLEPSLQVLIESTSGHDVHSRTLEHVHANPQFQGTRHRNSV